MKKVLAVLIVISLAVGVGVVLSVSLSGKAQVKRLERPKVQRPEMREIPKLCMKADLAQWQDNLPLGPKGEFPFEGSCKNCYLELGAMNLPAMSVWIQNKGNADAPASKAQLSWRSAKPPYQVLHATANVPALPKGEKHLLTITPPSGSFFQTARQIQLTLDSAKQIDECNEGNNILNYKY